MVKFIDYIPFMYGGIFILGGAALIYLGVVSLPVTAKLRAEYAARDVEIARIHAYPVLTHDR